VARTATPTAAATPAVETGGFDKFRAFAQLIEAALKERDAQFFIQRARVSELTCSGEQEVPLPCAGKPAGTILTGIPSRAWASDAWALLSPAEYAPWLERYFGAARGDLSDSYGSGSLTLYALAHSQEQGNEVFRAVATSMVDINPSGTPIGQTQREAHVFNFVFENGRWQFTGERVAVTSTTSPDWLSGQCGQCYDHWERWGGATPPSTPTPTSIPSARIAFVSERDGNPEIYVMNVDGSGLTRLTNNPAGDYAPAWSPDGSKIAFHSDRDDNLDIYVMNADGTSQSRLTNNPGNDEWPAWSPDGSKIAFSSERGGNEEVYLISADGTGETNLTNNPAQDSDPAWSPDLTALPARRSLASTITAVCGWPLCLAVTVVPTGGRWRAIFLR
jgi:hypothetical protein